MHEDHIRIAAPPHIQRLAGAECHHAHADARGLRREDRQDVAEQAGLLGADVVDDTVMDCVCAATVTGSAAASVRPRPRNNRRNMRLLPCFTTAGRRAGRPRPPRSWQAARRRPRPVLLAFRRPRHQQQHLARQAPGLTEVMRGHHDLRAPRGDARRRSPPPRGSPRGRGWRSARPGTAPPAPGPRRGRAPGAAVPRRRAGAPGGRQRREAHPPSAGAGSRPRAIEPAASFSGYSALASTAAPQQHRPLEHHRLPRPRIARRSAPRPAPGASSPCSSRSSTDFPAPFGPTMSWARRPEWSSDDVGQISTPPAEKAQALRPRSGRMVSCAHHAPAGWRGRAAPAPARSPPARSPSAPCRGPAPAAGRPSRSPARWRWSSPG
jgi:hypothetical protein